MSEKTKRTHWGIPYQKECRAGCGEMMKSKALGGGARIKAKREKILKKGGTLQVANQNRQFKDLIPTVGKTEKGELADAQGC